jgi:hypothetical protein
MKRAVKCSAQKSRKPCGFNARHDEIRTGSGPGSLRGQPAWGGGSDRVERSTTDSERPEL